MKKAIAACVLAAMLPLTGCAAAEERLGRFFLERSGVTEQEDYLRYEQYREDGKLDESGQYRMPEEQGETALPQQPEGKIHVTFADNRYMKILYYTDASMTVPLTTGECYLNPGDSVYAELTGYNKPKSNLYRLAEYRIREYDANGNVQNEDVEKATGGVGDVTEYKIPADFAGAELSILPVGEYADRQLSVDVYYLDDGGKEHSLGNAGSWSINDADVQDGTVHISPLEPYVLKFTYDTDNYFYVSSAPECFTKDPADAGFVEFWEAEPTDADTAYRVELHPYLNLSLKCSEKAQVRVGTGEAENIKKNEVWSAEKLSYGDTITIETAGECTITAGDYQHVRATKDPILKGYRYTLSVVQDSESNAAEKLILTVDVDRVFDVVLGDSCDYGNCSYKLDGDEVSGKVQLQEGQKLTLTYNITREGYAFRKKSEGIGGFFHDLLNRSQRTVTIPITADLDGTEIDPDDWFDIAPEEK